MVITMPRYNKWYSDRALECQEALEEIFEHVLATAERCGWSQVESAKAMRELAAARLASDHENELTTTQVASTGMTKH
jgi:hypothetical protein